MGRHPICHCTGPRALLVLLLCSAPAPASAHEPLRVTAEHAYDLAAAKNRLGYLLDYWQGRFGIHAAWGATRVRVTGAVHGVTIDGWIELRDRIVVAEVADPGLLWRGTAQTYVGRMLRKYLHPTYAEE